MEREKKTKVKSRQSAKEDRVVQVKRSETTDPVFFSKTPVNSELQLVKMLRGGAGELSKKIWRMQLDWHLGVPGFAFNTKYLLIQLSSYPSRILQHLTFQISIK